MNVNINGNEKNKNEIIYNNLIDSMNEMKMSKEDQIEYLKLKVANLESEARNKFLVGILLVSGIASLALGLYLMYIQLYLLGLIFILVSFIGMAWKLVSTAKNSMVIRNNKYDEVEKLKNLLNSKLK